MSVYILRPNADAKADWTETPVGTAYSALDESVLYPDAPDTADNITSSTNVKGSYQEFETFTLGVNEVVLAARVFVYGKVANASNLTAITLWDGTTAIASGSQTRTSYGWDYATYEGALTQTQINALQSRVTTSGTTAHEVDAIYIEVVTHNPNEPYAARVIGDSPSLYWRLNESSGTRIYDHSGNSNHGQLYDNQAVAATGVTLDQGSVVQSSEDAALLIKGHWTDPTPTQDYPGAGIRADSYKPYTVDAIRSFECWVNKNEDRSFATLFSASGTGSGDPGATNSPEPTWEMGPDGMMRFYANVETYPLTWMDWGTANTGFPDTDFQLNVPTHLVCIYDDTTGEAEWYVNGVSQGRQSTGYLGGTPAYNTVRDPGYFQVGWRGGYTTPNPEVFGGLVDEIAVYEYELSPSQILDHYQAGLSYSPPIAVSSTPVRLHAVVELPSGRKRRWATDEPSPENVPSGLSFSTTIPGGFEQGSLTLPRKSKISYSDVEPLSNLRILGAGGEVAWEGRIEGAPRSSGSEKSITVSAVGWQAALEDDQTAVMPYVDRDLGNWQGPTTTRRVYLYALSLFWDVLPDFSVESDSTSPALRLSLDGAAAVGATCEAWYDSKSSLGSIYYTWTGRNLLAADVGRIDGEDDSSGTGEVAGTDVVTATSGTGNATETSVSGKRWARAALARAAAAMTDGDRDLRLSNVAVYGDHGLTKRGTEPAAGFYASDVIGHAVATWAPSLSLSVDQTGFVIPHIAFLDFTTAAAIVREANRFHLNDWGVWEDKTFHYYEPGARGRTWRARVSEANLQEAGPQIDKVWNGVVVSYPDVDGTTRTVGPTGSVADSTSADLIDSDPSNPANAAGLRRWVLIQSSTVTTLAGATEIGRRFLVQSAQVNTSGQADIVGTVEDSKGVKRPAWQVRAGDYISFIDASDTSPRKIVRTSYDADSLTNSIDLDAPPEGLDALLERLSVVLVPLGL